MSSKKESEQKGSRLHRHITMYCHWGKISFKVILLELIPPPYPGATPRTPIFSLETQKPLAKSISPIRNCWKLRIQVCAHPKPKSFAQVYALGVIKCNKQPWSMRWSLSSSIECVVLIFPIETIVRRSWSSLSMPLTLFQTHRTPKSNCWFDSCLKPSLFIQKQYILFVAVR